MVQKTLFYQSLKTPIGRVWIRATNRGVSEISPIRRGQAKPGSSSVPKKIKVTLERAKDELRAYFANPLRYRSRIQIDWSQSSFFSRRVFNLLRTIPTGETISYSALARRAGFPKAYRAVGNALKHNRIPIIIPCHRVVRKNGEVGGFSWGLEKKKKLLAHEHAFLGRLGGVK